MEWDQMWKLYQSSSNNLAEREDILNALGCSKEKSILEVYFKCFEMTVGIDFLHA